MDSILLKALAKVTSSRKQIPLFVYETLLNTKLRDHLLKRKIKTFVDKLVGFKEISVETNQGKYYHTIIPDTDVVLGRRFYITPSELKNLDAWEDQYQRKLFRLGSGIRAWVYVLRKDAVKDMGHNLFA